MKIIDVQAREILDSRGMPTIECTITLSNTCSVSASAPSGTSKSAYEAFELRDKSERLGGMGVLRAVKIIEDEIAPVLIGLEPDVVSMDAKMLSMDGTDNKEKFGANTIIAVSMAIAKAQALVLGIELYELIAYLCSQETVMLPLPFFNFISGGVHAHTPLCIQEFMVVPLGAKNFQEAMEYTVTLHAIAKDLLKSKHNVTSVEDEGAFSPCFLQPNQALDFLLEAIEKAESINIFKLALDVAASHFFNKNKKAYNWHGQWYEAHDMINLYSQLIADYPICSIEDGLDQDDWHGWMMMTERLGQFIQIVGDDLFATNPQRIYEGIQLNAANAAIIKPNQIGTVTETLQAIQLCKEYGLASIVSHRSGETNDTFIADLAVGTSAGQIKAGGCVRGERLAKYNRLVAIERDLMGS